MTTPAPITDPHELTVRSIRLFSGWLVAGAVATLAALLWHGEIHQPQGYHAFADTRSWLGLANAANVVSNAGFLVLAALVGPLMAGAWAAHRGAVCFFIGVTLTGVGSAWYHLSPSDTTLVWDRLPMTIAFVALTVEVGQRVYRKSLDRVLLAAILVGLGSVGWWRLSGDLRPYVVVQFYPLFALSSLLALRPFSPGLRVVVPDVVVRCISQALVLYVGAKLCEHFDGQILALSAGLLGGHALKHVLAALACHRLIPLLRP